MSTRLQMQMKIAPSPSFIPIHTGLLQRKCASNECEERRKKQMILQRSSTSQEPSEVPSIVHDVLRSPGEPLDLATRAFVESRLGHDFSKVRVHADAKAAESARAVNAFAYTVGRDIVFGAGHYEPTTREGRSLIAHELVHVIQQGNRDGLASPIAMSVRISNTGDALEQEASKSADSLMKGNKQSDFGQMNFLGLQIQRQSHLPGKTCMPTNRIQTNYEHQKIQEDYLMNLNPNSGAKEFSIPAATLKGFVGYADLVDMETFELFEIKPGNPWQIFRGWDEVILYEYAAKRWCDKRWHRGKNYPALRIIPGATKGGHVLLSGMMTAGLILYAWLPLKEAMELLAATAAAKQTAKKTGKSVQMQLHPELGAAQAAIIARLISMQVITESARFLLVCSLDAFVNTIGKLRIEEFKKMIAPPTDAQLRREYLTKVFAGMAVIGAVLLPTGIAIAMVPVAAPAAVAAPAVAAPVGGGLTTLTPTFAGATVFFMALTAGASTAGPYPVKVIPAPSSISDTVYIGQEIGVGGEKLYVVGVAEMQ